MENQTGDPDRCEVRFIGRPSPTAPRIQAGGHPCQGLYWTAKGERPRTALIATHYNVDFSEHYIAPFLAERGFGFLGWNTRFRGVEDQFLLAPALIDIAVGVRWLREKAAAERVVILGNSGGGSLMAAYQAEAREPTLAASAKGAAAEALANLPPADLYISLNAHKGRPEVLTDWMDPSVIDEFDPLSTDPALDPYHPDRTPPFASEFIGTYRAAQRARNNRITAWARGELARLNAAGTLDSLFPVFRTWADLRCIDPAIDPSERKPNWCYRGSPRLANRTIGIGRFSGLWSWLDMWSLEASPCQGALHLPRLGVPALVIQSLADTGVFPSDARAIHEAIGSADKQLHLVKGAHYFEDSPEERIAAADLMAGWLGKRA